ncbi:MAG: mechanosensitive ion channel family protein [Simkaniaceae bacterium]|nr:mechanosensitive ion channel family protein [Simkaniaceae bacterium]
MNRLLSLWAQHGWIVAVAFLFLLSYALRLFFLWIRKNCEHILKKTTWSSALAHALTRPLHVFVWVLAIAFSGSIMSTRFGLSTLYILCANTLTLTLTLFCLWVVLRFITDVERIYMEGKTKHKRPYDKTAVRAVSQILRIAVIFLTLIIYLETCSVNLSAILTFGGVGGIILGFAAKDLLANFCGGLMIYLDRPFKVGDWIRSPDKEIEGIVEMIGWRLTKIRTFSKRPLYVPNALFSTVSIENPSRMTNRRIRATVSLRYDAASEMNAIVGEVEEMIRNHEGIDTNMAILVRFNEFAHSSINFLVYCFTKTVKWGEYLLIQQEIFLRIIDIIESHGTCCAFPTRTLDTSAHSLPPLPVEGGVGPP